MRNKTKFVTELANGSYPSYDLIFIVETWLDDRTLDSQVCPDGFQIIRKDRKSKCGGGVLLLFRNELNVIDKTNNGHKSEHLCVDVYNNLGKGQAYRYICYYNPPGLFKEGVINLCESINYYMKLSPVFICGDFNLPHINWSTMTTSCRYEQPFLDLCFKFTLEQHVNESTYISGSTLDLVLTNLVATDLLVKCEVMAQLSSTCDHNVIFYQCTNWVKEPPLPKTYFCYRKGNYSGLNASLSNVCWDSLFDEYGCDVQKIYDHFLKIIHSQIEIYIPKKNVSRKINHNRKLRKLAKEKSKLFKRCKNDENLKSQYKAFAKLYDKEVRSFYDKIEDNVCKSRDNTAFYNYANKTFRMRKAIPAITTENGDMLTDNYDKAQHFNETFQSIFIQDDGKPVNVSKKTNVRMKDIYISEAKIEMALKKLSPKTSMTPDGIPPIVLKNCGKTIIKFHRRCF